MDSTSISNPSRARRRQKREGKAKKTGGSGLAVTLGSVKSRDVDGEALFPRNICDERSRPRIMTRRCPSQGVRRLRQEPGPRRFDRDRQAVDCSGDRKGVEDSATRGIATLAVTVSYFQPDAPIARPSMSRATNFMKMACPRFENRLWPLVVAGEMKELVLAPPPRHVNSCGDWWTATHAKSTIYHLT